MLSCFLLPCCASANNSAPERNFIYITPSHVFRSLFPQFSGNQLREKVSELLSLFRKLFDGSLWSRRDLRQGTAKCLGQKDENERNFEGDILARKPRWSLRKKLAGKLRAIVEKIATTMMGYKASFNKVTWSHDKAPENAGDIKGSETVGEKMAKYKESRRAS